MDTEYRDRTRNEAIARFWSLVSKAGENECWLWNGPRYARKTYARFRFHQAQFSAHRFSYEIHNEPISMLLHVCHTCDVPLCVNPAHLFLGTNKDNMADKIAKGRDRTSRKLNPSAVREIRANPQIGLRTFADLLGVSRNSIFQVRKNISYKWVTP